MSVVWSPGTTSGTHDYSGDGWHRVEVRHGPAVSRKNVNIKPATGGGGGAAIYYSGVYVYENGVGTLTHDSPVVMSEGSGHYRSLLSTHGLPAQLSDDGSFDSLPVTAGEIRASGAQSFAWQGSVYAIDVLESSPDDEPIMHEVRVYADGPGSTLLGLYSDVATFSGTGGTIAELAVDYEVGGASFYSGVYDVATPAVLHEERPAVLPYVDGHCGYMVVASKALPASADYPPDLPLTFGEVRAAGVVSVFYGNTNGLVQVSMFDGAPAEAPFTCLNFGESGSGTEKLGLYSDAEGTVPIFEFVVDFEVV